MFICRLNDNHSIGKGMDSEGKVELLEILMKSYKPCRIHVVFLILTCHPLPLPILRWIGHLVQQLSELTRC